MVPNRVPLITPHAGVESFVKTCPTCGTTYPDDATVCAHDRTALIAHESDALIGTTIADRYRILRLLGQGGMGRVYHAEHVMMGRPSAIKVINPSLSQDPEALGRFNREASSAARISHPNVCAIYDFGPTPGGPIYLAMEYIEGLTLRAILESEQQLPLTRAVELTRQCAEGLQAAHELGIVHRDLKPDNVMVVPGKPETVKLVDFGVAKAFGATGRKGDEVTRTGFVVGTPEYMSPEQLSGDSVDGRTDTYALAIVFYRMVTARHPFEADTAQGLLAKRLTEAPSTLAQARPDLRFPPDLQTVLDRAFAARPDDRFQTVSAFSDALTAAARSAPTDAPGRLGEAEETVKMAGGISAPTIPPTRIEADTSAGRLQKRLMPILGVVVVGAVAGGFYFLRGPEAEAPGNQAAGAEAGGGQVDDGVIPAVTDGPPPEELPPPPVAPVNAEDPRVQPGPDGTERDPEQQVGSQLVALQDSIIQFPARRAEFRARAESIYHRRNLPDSLRVTAAWTVAHSFQEELADSQALEWFRSAYDLVPADNLERRERLQLMIDQLQPSNP